MPRLAIPPIAVALLMLCGCSKSAFVKAPPEQAKAAAPEPAATAPFDETEQARKELLAVAKASQTATGAAGQVVRDSLARAKDAASRWHSVTEALLTNDDGRFLAASPETVARFTALYRSQERPSETALSSAQQQIDTLMQPVEAVLKDPSATTKISPDLQQQCDTLKQTVEGYAAVYDRHLKMMDALLQTAKASGARAKTSLREAMAELDRQDALKDVAALTPVPKPVRETAPEKAEEPGRPVQDAEPVVPPTPTVSPKPSPKPRISALIIGDGVRLRAEPSTSAAILAKLDKGARVTLLEPPQGEWCNVEAKSNVAGWIRRDYVRPSPEGQWEGQWITAAQSADFSLRIEHSEGNAFSAEGSAAGWNTTEAFTGEWKSGLLVLTGQFLSPASDDPNYALDTLTLSLTDDGALLAGAWADANGRSGEVKLRKPAQP